MKKRGLLLGAYWFTMYTTFFAILSLVFFVLENPDKSGSQEILADANDGKDALNGLAKKSQAADRCSVALRVRALISIPSNKLIGITGAVRAIASKVKGRPFYHYSPQEEAFGSITKSWTTYNSGSTSIRIRPCYCSSIKVYNISCDHTHSR
jgi:hypothetical protein